ncbi:MAG TPA: ribosomal RNA small subunit methyltransferase I, partial [Desulfobacteria bacterium]|nr:ribosomal RNA small subunit methyltransferase I [Desulfobacteria bacterium]
MSGRLFLCATPIGNLKDITLRALDVLAAVPLIAAEDTRHTRQLLNHFQIKTALTSYHRHNEQSKSEELIAHLKAGRDLALVSDAGLPGISDPGEILVKKAVQEDINLEVIPGAVAFVSGLVISGLPT